MSGTSTTASALKTAGSTAPPKQHVVLQGAEGHERHSKENTAVPTPKNEITAPPPPAGFQIKDEVEMLRAGFKNKHGEPVKSQSANIEL